MTDRDCRSREPGVAPSASDRPGCGLCTARFAAEIDIRVQVSCGANTRETWGEGVCNRLYLPTERECVRFCERT